MEVTWVQGFPTGRETGSFLTMDLGGTNLRVCWISLKGNHQDPEIIQDSYKIPDENKDGEAKVLWDLIAESLERFIETHGLRGDEKAP